MKLITNILFLVIAVIISGCYEAHDPRIHLRDGIRSDTIESNIVTRPVAYAFSALIGEGIVINDARMIRNKVGLLELYVSGSNQSHQTKRFRYRVEWLDGNGLLIETKTSVWLRTSAMGKSPFSFKVVAPRPGAVNFRMDTRKWE